LELRNYLRILRRRMWLIALCVVLAVVAGYANTSRQTLYTASATIYVGTRELTANPGQAQQTADALTAVERSILTFAVMIDSTPTAASALRRTGLARSTDSVVAATTAAPIPATQLIRISVVDPDPSVARDLANAMADSFVADVQAFEPGTPAVAGSFPSLPAYLFEPASLPVVPQRESALRNELVAGLFGLVAAAGLVLLLDYLDITVKGVADAERRLELPVLGAIPRSRGQSAPLTRSA
jgi:capsular polysaccharide biosynthesis protein